MIAVFSREISKNSLCGSRTVVSYFGATFPALHRTRAIVFPMRKRKDLVGTEQSKSANHFFGIFRNIRKNSRCCLFEHLSRFSEKTRGISRKPANGFPSSFTVFSCGTPVALASNTDRNFLRSLYSGFRSFSSAFVSLLKSAYRSLVGSLFLRDSFPDYSGIIRNIHCFHFRCSSMAERLSCLSGSSVRRSKQSCVFYRASSKNLRTGIRRPIAF